MKMETAYQNLWDASSSKRKVYSNKYLHYCQVINLTLHFKKTEKQTMSQVSMFMGHVPRKQQRSEQRVKKSRPEKQ